MLNWVGMLAVGLALEAMLTLLTMKGVPFFMLLLIISMSCLSAHIVAPILMDLPGNVSVCFLPIDVLPTVFRYGYAFPFYNVSSAVRTILFDTKNKRKPPFGYPMPTAF